MNTQNNSNKINPEDLSRLFLQDKLLERIIINNPVEGYRDVAHRKLKEYMELDRGYGNDQLDQHLMSNLDGEQQKACRARIEDVLGASGSPTESIYSYVNARMDTVDGYVKKADELHDALSELQMRFADGSEGHFIHLGTLYDVFLRKRAVELLPQSKLAREQIRIPLNTITDKAVLAQAERLLWTQRVADKQPEFVTLGIDKKVETKIKEVDSGELSARRSALDSISTAFDKLEWKPEHDATIRRANAILVGGGGTPLDSMLIKRAADELEKATASTKPLGARLKDTATRDSTLLEMVEVLNVSPTDKKELLTTIDNFGITRQETTSIKNSLDEICSDAETQELSTYFEGGSINDGMIELLLRAYPGGIYAPGHAEESNLYAMLKLHQGTPADDVRFRAILRLAEKRSAQKKMRSLVETHTMSMAQAKSLATQVETLYASPEDSIERKRGRGVLAVIREQISTLESDISTMSTRIEAMEARGVSTGILKKQHDAMEARYLQLMALSDEFGDGDSMISLDELDNISAATGTPVTDDIAAPLYEKLHHKVVDTAEESMTQIVDENLNSEELSLGMVHACLNMPSPLDRTAFAEITKDYLRRAYKIRGEKYPEHIDELTFDNKSWFYAKKDSEEDDFFRFDTLVNVREEKKKSKGKGAIDRSKTDDRIRKLATILVDTALGRNTDVEIKFIHSEKGSKIRSKAGLEDAIDRYIQSTDKQSDPSKLTTIKDGSIWSTNGGAEQFEVYSVKGDYVYLRESGKVKATAVPITWFYLMATHSDPKKRYVFERVASAEETEQVIKDKPARVKFLTPSGIFQSVKSLWDMRKERSEQVKKMRSEVVQLSTASLFGLTSLAVHAEESLLAHEAKYHEDLKKKLDPLDNNDRRAVILKFMSEVYPGHPNLMVMDSPRRYRVLGKKYAHIEVRALAKGMLLYMLETYGQLYPFEEMRTQHQHYWLDLMVQDNRMLRAATAKSTSKKKEDGFSEYEQLKAAMQLQPGLFGSNYAAKLDSARSTGEGKAEETLKSEMDNCVSTGDFMALAAKYIYEKRWVKLEVLLEKLSTKGAKSEDLFNIFLYIFDQTRYVRNGTYYCDIPFERLQSIGKKIFPFYPDVYYFMFRGAAQFRILANSIDRRIAAGEIASDPSQKGKILWDKSGKLPKPVTNTKATLAQIYTMEGDDLSLLHGYATQKDPYLAMIENFTGEADYKMNTELDASIWTRCTFLTTCGSAFGMIPSNWTEGGFANPNTENYFDSLLKHAKKLKYNTQLSAEDTKAYMVRLQELFYANVYAGLSIDADVVSNYHADLAGRQITTKRGVVIEKKDSNKQMSFLRSYYKDLEDCGLGFNDCAAVTKNAKQYMPTHMGKLGKVGNNITGFNKRSSGNESIAA